MELSWLVIRDFNSQLSPVDKQGGINVTSYATANFQEFAIMAGVEDLHFIGCQFTWTSGHIVSKLDCAIINILWLEQDRSSFADF